jgi:hypothetical protein
LELRLVFAVAIVLIVAFFAVRATRSGSAPPESPGASPMATSDAAAASRTMTFTQPKAPAK